MGIALKTTLAANFAASARHDPRYNRVEGFDEALTGFSESLIHLASTDLNPGQSSSFVGVANGVKNKGANVFSGGGGSAVTFAGGGMNFPSGAAGTAGLKIGIEATGSVKHVSDLTNLNASERPFFASAFKLDGAPDSFGRPIYMLSDSATSTTGKAQFVLNVAQLAGGGLRMVIAGQVAPTGFVPVVGKIYVFGCDIAANSLTGLTTATFWIYNATDDVLLVDGATVTVTYTAWAAMTAGGAGIGFAYGAPGYATFNLGRIYRATQGVVSTTSVAPRTAEEQFFTECRIVREAVVAAAIS